MFPKTRSVIFILYSEQMREEDALSKNSRFPIMDWAKRLQAIAQTGLTYTKDQFDAQRYGSVRQIASEMMSSCSTISSARLVEIFDCEVGYATPKIDVRAAAFSQDALLLVKERSDGAWTLPGGWADVGDSPALRPSAR